MITRQQERFPFAIKEKGYSPVLRVSFNTKGVVDCDTVKGCRLGLQAYPNGGCYGECYANKTAARYGLDFSQSVKRKLIPSHIVSLFGSIKNSYNGWYRIGVAGDPSHEWEHTVETCETFRNTGKKPVIVTKHWLTASDDQLKRLAKVGAIFNTSLSAMDTEVEIWHRLQQFERVRSFGAKSFLRVVTCEFGKTHWGQVCADKQASILSFGNIIDTPFRTTRMNKMVLNGDIMLKRQPSSCGGGSKYVSLHNKSVHIGSCSSCPDKCGFTN